MDGALRMMGVGGLMALVIYELVDLDEEVIELFLHKNACSVFKL